MKNLKNLILLHSNDMHGDFLAEDLDGRLMGGISRLSGYVNSVRRKEPNTLYVISGDMFCGSLIDSDYKGISTIELVNLLAPDVVTLGNHEVDYGLGHLLFIEKCAQFPIINANLYLTTNYNRLFRSHLIKEVGGMRILFIGILTETVLQQTRANDKLVGTLVNVEEASLEVGKICDAYRTEDIDFTVLLTHIGFEEDKRLAELLNPDWGVDLIIGGHSHTLLEKPEIVNGIPIVQAACGTDQIGRFDIVVDTDRNAIDSFRWQLIPIDAEHCPEDKALTKLVQEYKTGTDRKYERILTRFSEKCTHPARNQETTMGRVFSDALMEMLGVDIMLVGTGSLRTFEAGPIFTLRALMETYPYEETGHLLTVSGSLLRKMVLYILSDEAYEGDHTEFFQFSHGMRIEYDRKSHRLLDFSYQGKPIQDEDTFRVGIQGFHYENMETSLGITPEEASALAKPRLICTNTKNVLEEYFCSKEYIRIPEDARLILHPAPEESAVKL